MSPETADVDWLVTRGGDFILTVSAVRASKKAREVRL